MLASAKGPQVLFFVFLLLLWVEMSEPFLEHEQRGGYSFPSLFVPLLRRHYPDMNMSDSVKDLARNASIDFRCKLHLRFLWKSNIEFGTLIR